MKKFIFLMLAMFTISISANADGGYATCRVSGGNGATVSASIIEYDQDGYVTVEFSSDCDDYVAVSFTLTVKDAKTGFTQSRSYVYSVQPNSNDQREYFVYNFANDIVDATVTIGGARCEQ